MRQALGELGRRVRLQDQARAQAAAERDELLAAQLVAVGSGATAGGNLAPLGGDSLRSRAQINW